MFVVPIFTLPLKSMWSLMKHQLCIKKIMSRRRRCLGEEIIQLILGRHVAQMYFAGWDILKNEVIDVFGSLVKNKICDNLDDTRVVFI